MNMYQGKEEKVFDYSELIEKNKTAFYVFDLSVLKSRIAYLRKKLPEQVKLVYAVKANTFISGGIKDDVDRFEICSPGEAHICEKQGIPYEKMVISGVYKTPEFIEDLVSRADGPVYTVESLIQFELLKNLSERYGKKIPVLLRMTNGSQFGINAEEIENIIARREEYALIDIHGIQFFSGTQKTSLKKLRRELEHLELFIEKVYDEYGFEVRELEYGPGFPVSYFKDEEFNEDEFLDGFSELINEMKVKPVIALELGRSIAASCGKYFTHIVDYKTNKGQNYILTDGGMHHIVYFGQHMAMKQPYISLYGGCDRESGGVWNICGSLCSMNDIIAKQIELPKFSVGDVLCFENTGAYCMTEGISLFLSREFPAVWLIGENSEVRCLRMPIEASEFNM